MPYLIKISIEFITLKPISYEFDVFCDFAAASNPCINAYILFKLDSKVRNNVLELVGKKGSSLASQASKLALSNSKLASPSHSFPLSAVFSLSGVPSLGFKSVKPIEKSPSGILARENVQDPSSPVFERDHVLASVADYNADAIDSMMPTESIMPNSKIESKLPTKKGRGEK
jgi:hypothetical protein